MTWKHSITFTKNRGKIRAQCACSAQSPRLYSPDEVREWATQHTGLKEKTVRRGTRR